MDRRAFTIKYTEPGLLLKCDEVGIEIPEDMNIKRTPPIEDLTALWDTGLAVTVISSSLVKKLGLSPVSITKIVGAQGETLTQKYIINISLPNGCIVTDVLATEIPGTEDTLIIGMDVISLGDFAISKSEGFTMFSFQIPSSHSLDFSNEIDEHDAFKARDRNKGGFKKNRKR